MMSSYSAPKPFPLRASMQYWPLGFARAMQLIIDYEEVKSDAIVVQRISRLTKME